MNKLKSRLWLAAMALAGLAASNTARAASVPVAVAANFTATAKDLAAAFQAKTGDRLALSFGSSGQFYAQIAQGAPYEVFLSADAARPAQAEKAGLAVPGSAFTYAIGRLVLWSATAGLVDASGMVLHDGTFAHIANADPKSAPYGAAGLEVMKALGVYAALQPRIVTGESITQAYQFVASGNAELGFVAFSQVIKSHSGSTWIVPQALYQPIRQDAVLLNPGADDPAARAFLAFLKSPEAVRIIIRYGYATPGS